MDLSQSVYTLGENAFLLKKNLTFIYFKRERKHESQGGAEKEGERIASRLCAVSTVLIQRTQVHDLN